MILLGQHHLALDNDRQLNLPARVCAGLQDHAYLVQGFDHNLLLMTAESFERYYSSIKNTSLSDPVARLLSRLFLANTVEMNIDGTNRIQLTPALCEYAGLADKVILVGQGDYYEIWSPAGWEEQTTSLQDHEANANRFSRFNLGTA